MMTPVYNVAIADWRTNSCSVYHYAVRLDLSVFSTILSQNNKAPLSRKTDLITCCVHSIKRYSLRCFHLVFFETTKYNQRKRQPTKKNSLSPETSSKYDDSRNNRIYTYYNSEVNSLTYFNFEKVVQKYCGNRQNSNLREKSENNRLRSYIKEQPADDTTTATDEEK